MNKFHAGLMIRKKSRGSSLDLWLGFVGLMGEQVPYDEYKIGWFMLVQQCQ